MLVCGHGPRKSRMAVLRSSGSVFFRFSMGITVFSIESFWEVRGIASQLTLARNDEALFCASLVL